MAHCATDVRWEAKAPRARRNHRRFRRQMSQRRHRRPLAPARTGDSTRQQRRHGCRVPVFRRGATAPPSLRLGRRRRGSRRGSPPEPEAAAGGMGTPFEDPRGSGPAKGGAGLLAASCSSFQSAIALRLAPALDNFQNSGGMLGGRDDPERTRVHRPNSSTQPGLPANFAAGCSGSHPTSPTSTTFSGMYATSA